MNDVELWFCTYPGHPELPNLIEVTADHRRPAELRVASLGRLRALARAELATAHDRWTPYYDDALRLIEERDDGLLDASTWLDQDGTEYQRRPFDAITSALGRHHSFVALFHSVLARGGHLLSDAFELVSIATSEASAWFRLVPDQEALAAQLREAARRCLARMPVPGADEIHTHRAALKAVSVAETMDEMFDLALAPLELFVELGNPFLPRTCVDQRLE